MFYLEIGSLFYNFILFVFLAAIFNIYILNKRVIFCLKWFFIDILESIKSCVNLIICGYVVLFSS